MVVLAIGTSRLIWSENRTCPVSGSTRIAERTLRWGVVAARAVAGPAQIKARASARATANAGVSAEGGACSDHPDCGGEYQSGEVFVMNERGATVAVYRNLGPIPNFDLERFKSASAAA